jgi:hypothetical protein
LNISTFFAGGIPLASQKPAGAPPSPGVEPLDEPVPPDEEPELEPEEDPEDDPDDDPEEEPDEEPDDEPEPELPELEPAPELLPPLADPSGAFPADPELPPQARGRPVVNAAARSNVETRRVMGLPIATRVPGGKSRCPREREASGCGPSDRGAIGPIAA